jgi:hypothetical protein
VNERHVTLLVENLARLAEATKGQEGFPALQRMLSRGRPGDLITPSANHLRFALFGVTTENEIPVAALTHVNDSRKVPQEQKYWLRSDPVTLWADMARVFMTSAGFSDLDPFERDEVENCVRAVLQEEGIHLHSDHPERWCIALDRALDFEFTPLDDALGADVGEALPEHPEARHWKRVMNEIQVALHHCPVNIRRRQARLREVNSVWFWGGGFIPEAVDHEAFDTVYSDDPVTRGLAIINDCRLKTQAEVRECDFSQDGQSILVDWVLESRDARQEIEGLERTAVRLLEQVSAREIRVSLFEGSGFGRDIDAGAMKRFWRREKPLAQLFGVASRQ